jgi:hypothetical protein
LKTEDIEMLIALRKFARGGPDNVEAAFQSVSSGIRDAMKQARADQIEWETIALTAMDGRLFGSGKKSTAQRIEKIMDRACFDWTSQMDKLEK